jgi:hypothetical protein
VQRQQDNLARHLALFTDLEAAAPVVRQLEALREQQERLTRDREQIQARRANWEAAQQRLSDLEAWCHHVAGRLGELTYEQKRDALTALGVEVRVYPKDHNPRYVITLALPLPDSVAYSSA